MYFIREVHVSQISLRGTTEWSERNNIPLLHVVEWEYKVGLNEVEIPSYCLSKCTLLRHITCLRSTETFLSGFETESHCITLC